jgi:DNA-binding transcriptional MerR regulator
MVSLREHQTSLGSVRRRRYLHPREVAAWLGVAPVTLRKWAIEFRLWLSPAAAQVSRGVARRYIDADLIVLSQVRAYLARNFTYSEVQTFLAQKVSATSTSPAQLTRWPQLR